jgi:hypothetical protein
MNPISAPQTPPALPPALPPAPPAAPPDRDDEEEPGEPTEDDMAAQVLDLEAQKRLWLRAIVPLLAARSHDSDPSGRVQFSIDMMYIAACERVRRLLESDLTDKPA